ncbi:MAG: 5-formyltetrahydrofolate cyclo-ligase [Gammaproteobacteria bacterium]|nr:5-formyltetrahydrofolate cyclo-ligase [Gammaproteobacteria bacterium]NIR98430.1 5-formyltetrahydrofolate cyclo-ligase [Gammaproteobacteria bacterium]NIT64177.1 5-formyltetrahydrofolate cyclo-ligase [Gammaproteobacteria bacterium]NIV21117.1 5-formyltetrahydrofolate cyclo-ligase [Gammaproteobacteria bacterium]NIX10594.1 5-formyltetrahydrofolate cyclo-ligase [Gammaproteobacteria bacterium]
MPTETAADGPQPDLRRRMRRQRRALPARERTARALELTRHLVDHPLFLRSRRIAGYLAVNGEMDAAPLMQRGLAMRKAVHLPVLVPYRYNRLWFAPCDAGTRLVANRYGIPEPAVPRRALINPVSLDLVLVPLVAFDRHCNRLGMGGGYYDRTFGFLRHRGNWRKPHLVGLAYEFQRVSNLDRQPWDVPLTAVATERGLYWPQPIE